MDAAGRAAQTLQDELRREDFSIFASPGTRDRPGPFITAIQLVSDNEAQLYRARLDALVADFRALASQLIAAATAESVGDYFPDEVTVDGVLWSVWTHGEHCLFKSRRDGTSVDAHNEQPARIDPYFLLKYASTSRRYPDVIDLCTEGFHDMCRLLDVAGVATSIG